MGVKQDPESRSVREGKNQEDLIGSEMDLLCEPDVSGLLTDLLCTLWTSCGPATSIVLPPSDLLWNCLPRTSCGSECIWLFLAKQISRKSNIIKGKCQNRIFFYLWSDLHGIWHEGVLWDTNDRKNTKVRLPWQRLLWGQKILLTAQIYHLRPLNF